MSFNENEFIQNMEDLSNHLAQCCEIVRQKELEKRKVDIAKELTKNFHLSEQQNNALELLAEILKMSIDKR